MMKRKGRKKAGMYNYWALDYINYEYNEFELVYDDQLYASEEEAMKARAAMPRPELFKVVVYSYSELLEVYHSPSLNITSDLKDTFAPLIKSPPCFG